MRLRIRRLHGMAVALLLAATPAAAQDGVLDSTGMGVYALEETVMQAARETVTRPSRREGPRVVPAPARLTYRPSMERRRANAARFVAKSRKRDPQGAARLEKQFATTDVIGDMERALAGYGMRADNVGDAYAAWWLNAWLASRGRVDTPPARQIAAVRAQSAQALTAAGLAEATDAVKQEIAEANLVQAALIGAHMDQAKANPALARRVAAAVVQGARASGLDLEAMELTDGGFVPRR